MSPLLALVALSLVSQGGSAPGEMPATVARRSAVFPLEDTNLDDALAARMGALLADAWQELWPGDVMRPAVIERMLVYRASLPADAIARAMGVHEYLLATAIWHRDSLTLRGLRYSARGVLLAAAEATAPVGEPLRPFITGVVHKLMRAQAALEISTAASPKVTWVAAAPRRRIKLGMSLAVDAAMPGIGVATNLSFAMRSQLGRKLLAFSAGLALSAVEGSDAFAVAAALSVGQLMSDAALRPYWGAGVQTGRPYNAEARTVMCPFLELGAIWQPGAFMEMSLAMRAGMSAWSRGLEPERTRLRDAVYAGLAGTMLW